MSRFPERINASIRQRDKSYGSRWEDRTLVCGLKGHRLNRLDQSTIRTRWSDSNRCLPGIFAIVQRRIPGALPLGYISIKAASCSTNALCRERRKVSHIARSHSSLLMWGRYAPTSVITLKVSGLPTTKKSVEPSTQPEGLGAPMFVARTFYGAFLSRNQ